MATCILDGDFRVVFVQIFYTKRGNALSWEILSLNPCALFTDKNKRKSVLEITKMYYFKIQIIKLLNKK